MLVTTNPFACMGTQVANKVVRLKSRSVSLHKVYLLQPVPTISTG